MWNTIQNGAMQHKILSRFGFISIDNYYDIYIEVVMYTFDFNNINHYSIQGILLLPTTTTMTVPQSTEHQLAWMVKESAKKTPIAQKN